MNKIKKGDEVIVIAGKDKGKRGVIVSFVDRGERVIVEGINLAKKHVRANPNTGERGGIVTKAMPIHRSNIMIYDAAKQKRSRVGIRTLEDKTRVRFYKNSDQVIIEVKE